MKAKSLKSLKNAIDKARREYIRKRDSDFKGYARCISCGSMGDYMDCGHYYKRQHDWTTELGGEERNVNLQCVPCNGIKRGNIQGYAAGLIRKYGEGIVLELEQKKRTPKYWGVKALSELLQEYKEKLKAI